MAVGRASRDGRRSLGLPVWCCHPACGRRAGSGRDQQARRMVMLDQHDCSSSHLRPAVWWRQGRPTRPPTSGVAFTARALRSRSSSLPQRTSGPPDATVRLFRWSADQHATEGTRAGASPEGGNPKVGSSPGPVAHRWSTPRRRRPRGGVLLQQPQLPRAGDGLGAVGRAELVEDVGDVPLDGVQRDHQFLGDGLVGVAGGQQLKHL